MSRNTLFNPWKRNVAARSKPLGHWTRKTRDLKNQVEDELEDEDER